VCCTGHVSLYIDWLLLRAAYTEFTVGVDLRTKLAANWTREQTTACGCWRVLELRGIAGTERADFVVIAKSGIERTNERRIYCRQQGP